MTSKSPNLKDLSDEVTLLLELQLSAVEKQASGVLATADMLLYQQRQERLRELYEVLARHAAAA